MAAITALVVLVIILGATIHSYLKGKVVACFVSLIISLICGAIAFNYFELAAKILITKGFGGAWAYPGCFALLFVISFVIIRTIASYIVPDSVEFDWLSEQIGRVVLGAVNGFILSGLLLIVVAMMPIEAKYPYSRFSTEDFDMTKPSKNLFKSDDFVAGLFSWLSAGSLEGPQSFGSVHPDFLNEIYLSRHKISNGVLSIAGIDAVSIDGIWFAPENLRDTAGKSITPDSGHDLVIVRVGVNFNEIKDGGAAANEKGHVKFTGAQIRLVCTDGSKSKNAYPIGYIQKAGIARRIKLDGVIPLNRGSTKAIDFVFYVPSEYKPSFIGFKQNCVAKAPKITEQALEAVSFVPASKCSRTIAKLQRSSSAGIYGIELAGSNKLLSDLKIQIDSYEKWNAAEELLGDSETAFDGDPQRVVYTKVRLYPARTKDVGGGPGGRRRDQTQGLALMFAPAPDYAILSLKCSKPKKDTAVSAEQLPVLIDLNNKIHHAAGVIATARVGSEDVYEVSYCADSKNAMKDFGVDDGLVLDANGAVAKPFAGSQLSAQANVTSFYVLYVVRTGGTIITEVRSAGSKAGVGFEQRYEGFLVR